MLAPNAFFGELGSIRPWAEIIAPPISDGEHDRGGQAKSRR